MKTEFLKCETEFLKCPSCGYSEERDCNCFETYVGTHCPHCDQDIMVLDDGEENEQ